MAHRHAGGERQPYFKLNHDVHRDRRRVKNDAAL
jgi:hypothetical protein